MSVDRLHVRVLGVVQGVGFRPFVYRLAAEQDLTGWVLNDENGVTLEVEGPRADLLLFLSRLQRETPPAARIYALDHRFLPRAGFDRFEIRRSEGAGRPRVWVLPDLATCADCRREVLDPEDRRHGYAFTNCTNCGPRFTIIEGTPYDRPKTSMRHFEMCERCAAEYADPRNRRFHAQPNACAECGPRLELLDREGGVEALGASALGRARARLAAGEILGVKGIGGYHLMVDAGNESAVAELRARKRRPFKAFALMYRDAKALARHVEMPGFAIQLLESSQAPILILPRTPTSHDEIAPSVAPRSPSLGVFLPSTPLHLLLLEGCDGPVVATSANLSEQPMLFDDEAAAEHLPRWCDAILRHDRRIVRPADDSVVQVLQRPAPRPQMLRRARGYAPLPLLAPRELPCILALGAEMNATFAVSRGREILLSQHLGHLGSFEGREAYRQGVRDFLELHQLKPELVVHDLHPEYFTTSLAEEYSDRWQVPLLGVQHHHAHLAACALENELEGDVLGLCWDGTGYGPDGTVWGGEALRGDASRFARVASLRPFRLPGGDAAARQGWRVGLALLHEVYADELPRRLPLFDRIEHEQVELVGQMLRRGVRSPSTSSMGRLFDGVAALLDLSYENTHQAQSPQLLEYAAWRHGPNADPLPLPLLRGEGVARLDYEPLVRALVERFLEGESAERLAAGFHHALVHAALSIIETQDVDSTVLAGGVWCNRYLTEALLVRAERSGRLVHVQGQLPPTDGSLSAGQLWVGAHRPEQARSEPAAR